MDRLLLLDDNPDFGGHQVMTAYALDGLMRYGKWEVLALLHPDNAKNRQRWEAIQAEYGHERLKIETAPTRSAKFQALRSRFQTAEIEALRAKVEAFSPDLVLVSQGNIEQCSAVFRLKGRIRCPIVSYIPVPHTHAEMGAKLGALRDHTCRSLYDGADGFITISDTLGQMLRDYGTKGRIQIVENGIPLERFQNPPTREAARATLNLPESAFIWAQIGRVEFKQKGQDFSLECFQERVTSHPEEHLVFLGSGPDETALKERAASVSNVHCLPWSDNPAPLLAAIDGMLLPSRYEGVPLVMLEALANGVPVLATDRDGMCDWLPAEWRFPFRDQSAMLRAMSALRAAPADAVGALQEKVRSQHSVDDFQQAFNQALCDWI